MKDFTPVPNEWFDHLADGRLTTPMFTILSLLLRTCTWKTGVWQGTAHRIHYLLGGDIPSSEVVSIRQIQRYIKRLHGCRYITSRHVPGRRRGYKILLNNYVAVDDGEEKLLRPTILKDWQELEPSDDADDDAEVSVTCRGGVAEDVGDMSRIPDVPNVPDDPNGPNIPGVGLSVSQLADAGLRPAGVSPKEEKQNPFEAEVKHRDKILDETRLDADKFDHRVALIAENLNDPFGAKSLYHEDMPTVMDIAALSLLSGLGDAEIINLPVWAKKHSFWKKRVVDYKSLAKCMERSDEKGIINQYRSAQYLLNPTAAKLPDGLPQYRYESGQREILKGNV